MYDLVYDLWSDPYMIDERSIQAFDQLSAFIASKRIHSGGNPCRMEHQLAGGLGHESLTSLTDL